MSSNLGVIAGSQLRRVFSIQDHRLRRSRSRRRALDAVIIFKLLFGRRRCFAIPVVFYRVAHRSASDMASRSSRVSMMCRLRLCRGGHAKRENRLYGERNSRPVSSCLAPTGEIPSFPDAPAARSGRLCVGAAGRCPVPAPPRERLCGRREYEAAAIGQLPRLPASAWPYA